MQNGFVAIMGKASIRRAVSGSDLAKLIRQASGRLNLWDVFSDFIEMAAISLSNAVDLRHREAREARYMQIIRRYENPEQALFPKMMAAMVMRMEEGPSDVLGKLFSELELHNAARGQFFTPYELCQLMAGMMVGDDLGRKIERSGFVTINEPACGAGAMVIAFADAMQQAGFNYQRHLHVTAQDVDSRAVHMCYLQLSLMHIPARVILGNTLTLEQREVWHTPAHIIGGWDWRLRARASRGESTAEHDEPAATQEPIQITPIDPHKFEQIALF